MDEEEVDETDTGTTRLTGMMSRLQGASGRSLAVESTETGDQSGGFTRPRSTASGDDNAAAVANRRGSNQGMGELGGTHF